MPVKVPHNGAASRLIRLVLFDLIKRLGEDVCFRCGKRINSVDEFSIDHKESWRANPNPIASYFDMQNIAFSHRACNYRFTENRKSFWDKYKKHA